MEIREIWNKVRADEDKFNDSLADGDFENYAQMVECLGAPFDDEEETEVIGFIRKIFGRRRRIIDTVANFGGRFEEK